MSETYTCREENQLPEIAENILSNYPNQKIFIFRGDLGAGKTTLIKALCRSLQVTNATNSPSFAIINEYIDKNNQSIFHFDFYRINSIQEAFDIGYEEYLYSGKYCFIEWPEMIESLLPETYVEIVINWEPKENVRKIFVTEIS